MPLYESEELTREELDKIRKRHICAVCGAKLNMYLDKDGNAFVACWDWLRTHHEGIERGASRYEKEGLAALNIQKRREIMTEQHGDEKTKALDKYISTAAITKKIATDIVETLWGEAPLIEKTKAILLCQTYQLNPLMKHLYLIGYRRKGKDGKYVVDGQGKEVLDWSMQMGIGATRLLAQRRHNFSYLDLTPRKATEEELRRILGDTVEPDKIYGFVHIKDVDTGAEAYGLRGIGRNESIKGKEKGNTHLNQACIRAERQALDRQYPGEMPPNVEVVDERYIEAEYKMVDRTTGEITEQKPEPTSEAAAPDPKEHWCEEHNCAFELKTSRFGTFYAHKDSDGNWCNEKKKKEAVPAAEETTQPEPTVEPEESQKPKRDPDTIKTINDLFKACNQDFKLQPADVIKELGVGSQSDISDTPAECYRKIAAVRE